VRRDARGRGVAAPATFRGTDEHPKETFIHHDDRIRGPIHQGGPILRDRDADLVPYPEYWASKEANHVRFERHYYLLDWRGQVSAIIASDGTLVEQVRYSAAGVPFNIPEPPLRPLGDVDADGPTHITIQAGASGTADEDQLKHLESTGPYHIRGDLDLDGDVDAADMAIATAKDGTKTGRGYLTTSGADHRMLMPTREFDGGGVWNAGYNFGLATNVVDQSVLYLSVAIENNQPRQVPETRPEGPSGPGCVSKLANRPINDQDDLDELVRECLACCVYDTTPNDPDTTIEVTSLDCASACFFAFDRRGRNNPISPGGATCEVSIQPGSTNEEVCEKLRKSKACNVPSGVNGFIGCMGSRQIVCVTPNIDGKGDARTIIGDCVAAHERDHLPRATCLHCPMHKACMSSRLRGLLPRPDECSAYSAHVDCLITGIGKCANSNDQQSCRRQIISEFNRICKRSIDFCGTKPSGCYTSLE
jgi:hypothetical protein